MRVIPRFFLTTILVFISWNAHGKSFTVGVASEFGDKYQSVNFRLNRGVELAKHLFEKSHPGLKINLKKFHYGNDSESIFETGGIIANSGVVAVIGGETTLEAVELAEKLNQKKVVLVTSAPLKPSLTADKPFLFSTSFSEDQAGKAIARYVYEKLKPKSLGLFSNIKFVPSTEARYTFEEQFKLLVGKTNSISISHHEIVGLGDKVTDAIDIFKAQAVTHLVAFTDDTSLAEFVGAAARKSFSPLYIGGNGWGSNKYVYDRFIENSQWKDQFVAYRYYSWKEDSNTPMSTKFRKAFEAKHHQLPNVADAMAFDAAWVLFSALSLAKNPNDAEQTREQLKKLKDLELVTDSHFSFGADNIPVKDIFIYQISKNGIRYEATLR